MTIKLALHRSGHHVRGFVHSGRLMEEHVLSIARGSPHCHARGNVRRNTEEVLRSEEEPVDPFDFNVWSAYHAGTVSFEDCVQTYMLLQPINWTVCPDERRHRVSTAMHKAHGEYRPRMLQDRSWLGSVLTFTFIRF